MFVDCVQFSLFCNCAHSDKWLFFFVQSRRQSKKLCKPAKESIVWHVFSAAHNSRGSDSLRQCVIGIIGSEWQHKGCEENNRYRCSHFSVDSVCIHVRGVSRAKLLDLLVRFRFRWFQAFKAELRVSFTFMCVSACVRWIVGNKCSHLKI